MDSNEHGNVSRIGQIIGEAFEIAVIKFIRSYLKKNYPEYVILNPEQGKKLLTLNMPGGIKRQLDTVIAPKYSSDPVALLETKWLKDGRHWNDKGAWILQLREVRRSHPTVRGAAAILAGFWNEGVRVLLRDEGGRIDMILVATDEEVYKSIQPYLDRALKNKSFNLDALQIRKRFPLQYIDQFDGFLAGLRESGELNILAKQWLKFPRIDANGVSTNGKQLIQNALNELLKPLPQNPKINNYEITFEIETGNLIYRKFKDVEELLEFINENANNPKKILEEITPKHNKKQIGEQMGFYEVEEDDDDDDED